MSNHGITNRERSAPHLKVFSSDAGVGHTALPSDSEASLAFTRGVGAAATSVYPVAFFVTQTAGDVHLKNSNDDYIVIPDVPIGMLIPCQGLEYTYWTHLVDDSGSLEADGIVFLYNS